MKRKYEKPYMTVESFQLDAAVAQGCTPGLTINYSEDTCGLGDGSQDEKMFQFFNWANCAFDLSYTDGNDAVCYHGPLVVGGTFFGS